MRVSVIGFQGDVEEHVIALNKSANRLHLDCEILATRKADEIEESEAIVIPGGESTTISRLIFGDKISDIIIRLANEGVPVMGTCAGLILLAREGDEQVEKTDTQLLGLMDVRVKRNAFGRQRESFQTRLNIKGIGEFDAVFIRAPAITEAENGVDVLATVDEYVVAAKQDNILAFAFHPELADDTKVHEYFLRMI
jgi:5'-phosphate synthase pdxT subunit